MKHYIENITQKVPFHDLNNFQRTSCPFIERKSPSICAERNNKGAQGICQDRFKHLE